MEIVNLKVLKGKVSTLQKQQVIPPQGMLDSGRVLQRSRLKGQQ